MTALIILDADRRPVALVIDGESVPFQIGGMDGEPDLQETLRQLKQKSRPSGTGKHRGVSKHE